MNSEELRAIQAPLKQQYRDDPSSARVVMHATGTVDLAATACRVETDAGQLTAGLHPAAGGDGSQACSGDMLLQALVACTGVTFSAVATAMAIPILAASVRAEAEMDFRGTLGIDKSVPVGITSIKLIFNIDSTADDAQLDKLIQLTERYCVVLRTLVEPARLESVWSRAS